MNWLLRSFCFTVALGVLVSGTSAGELQVGDKAPDFELKGSDGKTYKLSDMQGKYVVIAWYPKAFTGGCTKECKSFKAGGEALRSLENVAYFTASCDTPELNADFAKSLELDYPILSDPTKETATAYGVSDGKKNATRWTFYIDPAGKVAHIDKKVNTEKHAEDVAAKLAELGAKKKS